jgi:hypothetical protein
MGLKRLMEYDPVRFQCSAFAVVSEESMADLCRAYGIEYITYPNDPVGMKKNAGMDEVLKRKDFDYLIELGSDDLILNGILDSYEPYMQAGEHFFGAKQIVFIDAIMGHCRQWAFDPELNPGLGRCMSRKLLETLTGKVYVKALTPIISDNNVIPQGKCGFLEKEEADTFEKLGWVEKQPDSVGTFMWSPINRGLDNDSTARIMKKGFVHKTVVTPEPMLIDMKSDENIWGFNPEGGEPYDIEKVLSKLTPKERSKFFANQKALHRKRVEVA